MRYLYGDSEPFPLPYDFLDTFRRFLAYAAPAAGRLKHIEVLEEQMAERGLGTATGLESVERFSQQATAAVATLLGAATVNEVLHAYGERVLAFIEGSAEEMRAAAEAQLRRDNADAVSAIAAHREQIRSAMERFLLESEVGGEVATITIHLAGKEYAIRETLRLVGGVEVTYKVNTDNFDAWREPRKLSSVAASIDELQVGLKKKFLRRDLTREMMKVGDHFIVGAKIREDGAEIELRKKLDNDKTPLLLMLGVTNGDELEAWIERPRSDGNETFPAVPADVEKIVALWETLHGVGQQALKHRKGVLDVTVDEVEVFREEPERILDRLVEVYVPIVREIAYRSPNQNELSLKVEHPDGRREEHYLRKTELAELIEPLPLEARQRFSALPLD